MKTLEKYFTNPFYAYVACLFGGLAILALFMAIVYLAQFSTVII